MARISRDSVKFNFAIPSKHFFKWGWTRVGSFWGHSRSTEAESRWPLRSNTVKYYLYLWVLSLYDLIPFVSERISKSSSFDKKKNLGKKSRFSSRYAFNPFWINSKRSKDCFRFERRPVWSVAFKTKILIMSHHLWVRKYESFKPRGSSEVFFMHSFQIASTVVKRRPSWGIFQQFLLAVAIANSRSGWDSQSKPFLGHDIFGTENRFQIQPSCLHFQPNINYILHQNQFFVPNLKMR